MGPSEITESQIIFFTEEYYAGLSYKVDSNELVELPLPNNSRPLAMRSYIQFGKDSWTTYHDKNFKGEALRFEASKTAENPSDSFAYNQSIMVIVGSVKKDSNSNIESSGSKVSAEIMALCFIAILTVSGTNFFEKLY